MDDFGQILRKSTYMPEVVGEEDGIVEGVLRVARRDHVNVCNEQGYETLGPER